MTSLCCHSCLVWCDFSSDRHAAVTIFYLIYEIATCQTVGVFVIWQCQVVLQGKSRSLIVRELQRTVSNGRVGLIMSELYALWCCVGLWVKPDDCVGAVMIQLATSRALFSWPPVELSSLSATFFVSVGGTAGYSIPIRRKKVSIRFDSRYRIDFFNSIRCGGLINLPLVHWYSNSKLGVIFIVCIA